MVAKTASLPNVKKMFLPDPNHVLCDSDLPQADARVVAWESGEQKLIDRFLDPEVDVHTENALDMFGRVNYSLRQKAKMAVHATNYHVGARTLARNIGISVREAQAFIDRWLTLYPGIAAWHDRVNMELMTTRTVSNKFGYSRPYFDRVDVPLLQQALAWIPQSTVGIITNIAWDNLETHLHDIVDVKLQVHDSLVWQIHKKNFHDYLPEIEKHMTITVPYDIPLTIPFGLSASMKSWGDCVDMSWSGKFLNLSHACTVRRGGLQ